MTTSSSLSQRTAGLIPIAPATLGRMPALLYYETSRLTVMRLASQRSVERAVQRYFPDLWAKPWFGSGARYPRCPYRQISFRRAPQARTRRHPPLGLCDSLTARASSMNYWATPTEGIRLGMIAPFRELHCHQCQPTPQHLAAECLSLPDHTRFLGHTPHRAARPLQPRSTRGDPDPSRTSPL